VSIDYSVIIPAYNEEVLLPATLASVRESMLAIPELVGETIVTDNNSSDRTADIATAAGARVVYEEHQQIARARNAGAQIARGRYFIFLDADTLLNGPLLRAALEALQGDQCCGGGTILRLDCAGLAPAIGLRLWGLISKLRRWAAGSFVFCRREAFTDIGGFEQSVYVSEEIHFSIALNDWGRTHQQRVRILDIPIVSSGRKFEWFGTWQLLRQALRLGLKPSAMRSRGDCELWYRRPDAPDGNDPPV